MKSQEGTTGDIRFVMTYGIGFITLTFLGFLSGYMIGVYFFKFNFRDSLIVSIAVGAATLILETLLMILRIHKMENMAARKKERNIVPGMPLNYPRSEAEILAHIS